MTKSSSRSIQHHPYREIIMDSENIANDGAALAEAMCGVIWAELPRWTLISLTGFGHSRDCCGGEHGPTTLSDLFDSWTFIEEAMALLGWGDGEWDPSSEAEAARINAAISLVDLLISEFPDPLVDYSTNDNIHGRSH